MTFLHQEIIIINYYKSWKQLLAQNNEIHLNFLKFWNRRYNINVTDKGWVSAFRKKKKKLVNLNATILITIELGKLLVK